MKQMRFQVSDKMFREKETDGKKTKGIPYPKVFFALWSLHLVPGICVDAVVYGFNVILGSGKVVPEVQQVVCGEDFPGRGIFYRCRAEGGRFAQKTEGGGNILVLSGFDNQILMVFGEG